MLRSVLIAKIFLDKFFMHYKAKVRADNLNTSKFHVTYHCAIIFINFTMHRDILYRRVVRANDRSCTT